MSEIPGDSSAVEEKINEPKCKRTVSGELDVFEATRYFSEFNDPTTLEYSRIQIQKQSTAKELRENRVHPETLQEPRVVVVKPQETTRGGGWKLTSFLNSLLRSTGLKKSKSKSKSTPKVETPRGGERRRRHSCEATVSTQGKASSPISDGGAWRLSARRISFDEKHVKDSKLSDDEKLNITFRESLCPKEKVCCKDRDAGDVRDSNNVKGGYESDSSSESDLFELDLFAKPNH